MIGIESVVVGLGELRVTRDPSAVLTCLGLGSCLALCVYDPVSRVAGLAHVVLPCGTGKVDAHTPKYADAAVALLVEEMRKHGASAPRLVFKVAGGAEMCIAPGTNGLFKIGARNMEAIRESLARIGGRIAGADVGGYHGRTVRLFADSGRVTVATAAAGIREI